MRSIDRSGNSTDSTIELEDASILALVISIKRVASMSGSGSRPLTRERATAHEAPERSGLLQGGTVGAIFPVIRAEEFDVLIPRHPVPVPTGG